VIAATIRRSARYNAQRRVLRIARVVIWAASVALQADSISSETSARARYTAGSSFSDVGSSPRRSPSSHRLSRKAPRRGTVAPPARRATASPSSSALRPFGCASRSSSSPAGPTAQSRADGRQAMGVTRDVLGHYTITGPMSESDILAAAEDILRQRLERQGILTNPRDCAHFLRMRLGHLQHEEFHAVWLDTRYYVLAVERLFNGTVDQSSEWKPGAECGRSLDHRAAARGTGAHRCSIARPCRRRRTGDDVDGGAGINLNWNAARANSGRRKPAQTGWLDHGLFVYRLRVQIEASSTAGKTVLDPFCGLASTCSIGMRIRGLRNGRPRTVSFHRSHGWRGTNPHIRRHIKLGRNAGRLIAWLCTEDLESAKSSPTGT
jgi:RadC-like JAB domain-containing protein